MYVAPIKKPVWWHSENSALLLMNSVSRSLADFARQYPDGFPSLQNASALIIGSDFSGDHKDAPFESICLLLVDSASVGAWQNEREYLTQIFHWEILAILAMPAVIAV